MASQFEPFHFDRAERALDALSLELSPPLRRPLGEPLKRALPIPSVMLLAFYGSSALEVAP